MNSILNTRLFKIRILWIIIAVVILIVGGITIALLSGQNSSNGKSSTSSSIQTATVKTGDITVTASGTGKLVASQEVSLNFPASGVVSKVNVKAGDNVKEGDILAELQNIESLESALHSANIDLATAQQSLDELKMGAESSLGNAQINLVNAKATATAASNAIVKEGMMRCDNDTTRSYYDIYMKAQQDLDTLGTPADLDLNSTWYLSIYAPAKLARDKAYSTWLYCNEYTPYEIGSSQANATLAAATLKQNENTLSTLTPSNGLDPYELSLAENKVEIAKIAVTKAQKNLDGAVMKAPFDGSIVSVAGTAGDTVGTGTFITIADLYHPYIEFYVDETDMTNVALEDQVSVVFDAMPNQTYSGIVEVIEPELVTSGNSEALKGLARLNMNITSPLPEGINCSVDVIGGEAKNVLLIPLQALRELGDDTYGVFVKDFSGKLSFRSVTIGLQDLTYVEITSGLNAGETVSTGLSELK